MNAQQLPPTNGTTNGRLRTNGSTAQRDEIAQFLVAYVAEHNGFPVEVIDRDADLETALQFGADQIPELLEEACRHFGGDIAVCRRELRHTHSLTLAAIETALCRALATSGGHAPAAVEKPCPSSDSEPAVSVVPEAERVMRRLVLRAVDAPLPVASQNQRSLNGSFALLGQNAAADALHERLTAAGVAVHRLPADSAVAAVAALDALWQQGPVLNLVLATARDEDAAIDLGDPAAWERRQEAGIMLPLLVCQRWFTLVSQTHQLETASVTAVTALGGDFGLTGHGAAVEGSGLAGLLKALEVETRGRLRAKVIDTFPRDPAKLIASEVLGELTADAGDVEVGYIRGKRYVLKAVPQPASTLARRPAPPQGTWVVTGGARGVTAVVARELGRQYGLRLHLLGTTAPPPIAPEWLALDEAGRKELRARIVREALAAKKNPQAEWGRIEKGLEMEAAFQSLREAGVEFTYHACDVADRMQLAAVLEAIRAQDGPITGILHGAGSETAGRFEKKTRDGMARVLASKAEGTAALIALTRHDPLQHFIGFGSTSGRFGAYVNADYALANNLLAGLLDRLQYERPDLRAFTVHWTAWSDVGMGARDRSRFILDAIQVRGMPPLEGAAHLIDELEAATSDPEIVICDHPDGVHSSHLTMPTAGEWSAMQARQSPIHDAPLIDTVVRPDTGGATAFLTLDPVRDPFLNGHMDNGVPLLPAVIGIESSAEAASLISGMRTVVGLRDVKLLNGFRMAEPRRHHARIRVTLDGDTAACQLSGEFYDKSGRMTDPDRLFQSCVVELADAPRPLATPNFGPLPESGWIEVPYPDDWRAMEGANSGTVYYGPELRSLKAVWHDADGAWGRLVAPPVGEIGGTRLGSHWHTPPSIIDALLFACDLFASYSFGTKQLPHVIDHVAIARLPRTGENCLSRILYRGRDGNRYTWDFWLLGDGGDVILSCEGCHFVDLNIAVATMPR